MPTAKKIVKKPTKKKVTKSKDKVFRLHYHISNNGDGSASVFFHQTREEAEQADEYLVEGWAEDCSGSVDLTVVDGKLHFDLVDINNKSERARKEIKQV